MAEAEEKLTMWIEKPGEVNPAEQNRHLRDGNVSGVNEGRDQPQPSAISPIKVVAINGGSELHTSIYC